MAKKKHNFEIIIRGTMSAYDKDEIIDQFVSKSGCYDFMDSIMGFYGDYNASIKVSECDENPQIGYYNTQQYETLASELSQRVYINKLQYLKSCMSERIKVCDNAIESLSCAQVGWFGNTDQIKRSYLELRKQRDELEKIYVGFNKKLNRWSDYGAANVDEESIESAKWILNKLKDVYMIREPKDTDTVGTTKGTVK